MAYTKTVWTSGLPLTIARLNNIETGIETASGAVTTRQTAAIAPTANITTSSTSFVDITGLTLSITTDGGDLLVLMTGGAAAISNASHSVILAINVNGTDYPVTAQAGTTDRSAWAGNVVVPGLPAGTYTIKGRFRATDPTISATAIHSTTGGIKGYATISAIEFKR